MVAISMPVCMVPAGAYNLDDAPPFPNNEDVKSDTSEKIILDGNKLVIEFNQEVTQEIRIDVKPPRG